MSTRLTMAAATAAHRLLLLTLLLSTSRASGLAISGAAAVDEATSYPGRSFSHMELYELRGEEFLAVAQTNQLINMRADFTAKYITQIGPRNDSTVCSPRQMQPSSIGIDKLKCQIHPMDNYMKAMTLHNGSLYFCMSYLSSSCAATVLTDGPLSVNFTEIDRKLRQLTRSLLCRNQAAETHLTVASKYMDSSPNAKSKDGLYLSMPFCSTKNLDNTVESVISIVELRTLQLFQIGTFSTFYSEILPHNSKRRPNALAYHYSFKYADGPYEYVYFLLTAREVVSSHFSQVRIGRLCTRDLYMTGYVEMHIYCTHADADPTATYGYVGEAATFAKAGSQLAASLGIPADEPVLFLSSRVIDSSLSNWRQGVCAVPISVINARLNRIVVDCLQGQAYFGPTYIRDHIKCSGGSSESQPASPWEEGAPVPPQCTPFQPPPEWRGMVGLKEQHRYQTSFLASVDLSVNITSLAVLPLENGATVLYIGTSAGRLLHYSVLTLSQSYLFDNASVGSEAVLSIRTGRRRLYSLTRALVASHPYATCEQRYLSCSACLGSRNPHCVWSNLATASGCQTWDRPGRRPDLASHVISAENCPAVANVNNADICVDKPGLERQVSVDVQLLQAPSVTYYCHYIAGGEAVMPSREAELQGSYHLGGSLGIRCPVDLIKLGLFLASRSSRRLAVQITGSQRSPQPFYASVDAEAFSCRLHSNCTSCTAGGGRRHLCSWCSLRAACVHQPAVDCPDDVARHAVANGSASGSCPLVGVANDAGDQREIAQPSGTSARLVYNLLGYQPFMQSFSCTVACPGSDPAEFPANLLEESSPSRRLLECRTGILAQQQPEPAAATLLCSVAFHWSDRSGGKHAIEPIFTSASRLLLYRCQSMAASCDDCTLSIRDDRFGCVWCPGADGDSCTAAAHCPAGVLAAAVKRGGLCPGPLIMRVQPPRLAPYAGLRLRVAGSNLGNRWDSVVARLQAESGGVELPCTVPPEAYTPGKGFECLLGKGVPLLGTRYRLLVSLPGLRNGSNASAAGSWLSVAKPTLDGLEGSAKAQQSGRADVRLLGSSLDAGSDLQVTMLSDEFMPVPAEVLSRASDSAVIRLGRFHRPGRYFASLSLQNQSESALSCRPAQLQVVPDAQLSLSPESPLRTSLIPAGGLAFDLPGHRLDAVRRSVIELRWLDDPDGRRFVGNCSAVQPNLLVCRSPPLPPPQPPLRRRRSSEPSSALKARFAAAVLLDSLERGYPANLTLFPDPVLHPVGSLIVELHRDWRRLGPLELQLTGQHLRPGLLLPDIFIQVGQLVCPVAALESPSDESVDRLTCRHQLPDSAVDVELPITAKVGRLSFNLGQVTYASQFNWTYVYLAIPLPLMLLFAVLVTCLVRSHRRSQHRQEKSSHIEEQINMLEAQVSQNCRDAFAELQLNSSGIGDPTGGTGEWLAPVPVRSFAEFASYSCFADRYKDRHRTQDPLFADVVSPEAAAAALSAEPPEVRKALGQLHSLLLNEDFLLIMIAAMEARSDRFMYQERNHFGSLLSALLYSDIGYFTRILSRLIKSLVSRRQEASDNYKVVFRRCDSVAERLLPNWLAFLMYEHLNQQVAGPLHRLYWAMRQQICKGPVDQVTGDSKYTINEQKLLKKEIPFKELTLTFQDRLRVFSAEQQQVQCPVSVLDCDTVHQAKEKILDAVYTQLGLPYSQRVPAGQFELARTFRGTAGVGGTGVAGEENSNERYLILTEIDNSNDDSDEGLERLRRLDSFNLGGEDQSGDDSASSIVVFLKPRKEPPRMNGSAAINAPRRSKGAIFGGVGDSSSQQASCSSSWRSLPDGGSSGGGKSHSAAAAGGPDKRRCHLLVPSGVDGQSLLSSGSGGGSGSGKKKRKQQQQQQQRGKRNGRTAGSDVTADGQHIVSEVFYPVLLRTKRLLTDKITDLFSALFPAPKSEQLQPEQDKEVPLCLKYLFDMFDGVVREHHLTHDVAHVWKSNALMLRFYTHHLFNVDYLLDVEVPGPVRYCMSTVSTLFMDACSYEKPAKPDKTSTAQRLLFVNEVAEFHPLVEAYYSTVRCGVQEADTYAIDRFEQQVHQRQCAPFNRDALLRELFTGFLCKYREEIFRELHQQQPGLSASLSESLEFVFQALSSASPYWSKAHTLSSTQSQQSATSAATRPMHATLRPHPGYFNPYEPAAC